MEENKEKNNIKVFLLVLAIILIIAGVIFVNKGFDVKDNYYQSENYTSLNKHVYVGGAAYNYIINANYFTGYLVLGSSLFVCSGILIATSIVIGINKK